MRDRLSSMSTWALLLVCWVPWVVLLFAMSWIVGGELLVSLGVAVVTSLILAVVMTFALKSRWRMQDRALGDVSKDLRRTALRAAWAGPVPADPEVRAAALRIAQQQLQLSRRTRPILIVAMAMAVAAAVISAYAESFWQLLFILIYLPAIASFSRFPKRLRTRIALLSEPG